MQSDMKDMVTFKIYEVTDWTKIPIHIYCPISQEVIRQLNNETCSINRI